MHHPSIYRSRSNRSRSPLQLEKLEARELLACTLGAGATYDAASMTLSIEGTNQSDNITAEVQVTDPDPLVSGDEISNLVVTRNGDVVADCSLADVTKLVINGGNGNDSISIDDAVLIGVEAHGGNGQDLIDGGGGNDTITGGNGNDSLDGAAGNDLLDGGNGVDSLQGGAGTDSLRGGNAPDILDDPDGDTGLDGGRGFDTINGVLETSSGRGRGRGRGPR